MARSGPIVIGFDGSDAAERAVREAGPLLAGRPALVVVVWKSGLGFELMTLPTTTIGLPPTAIDVNAALETDRALYERAERLAAKGAGQARDAGFDAEGLVIADDPDVPVADTLTRTAHQRDAAALVVGSHGHGPIASVFVGSTTQGVLRSATVPVVVVRQAEDE
jgi:nucleotide-binding universal stress UspA family protein